MSVKSPDNSPRAAHSPLGYGWKKQQDKASYVQRWKVLRERNRNLPKIDFSVKSQVVPKRQNRGIGIGARSLTLDSMKLPSICTTSSVITTSTNMSGNTSQTTKTTRTDATNLKKSTGLQLTKDNEEKVHSISRSLPNIATAVQNEGKTGNAKHRFEKFSYTKHLQRRKLEAKEAAKEADQSNQISLQLLEKSGIYHIDLSNLTEVSEPNSEAQTERIDRPSRGIGTIRENEPLSSRHSSEARRKLEKDKIGRRSRRKKWKDNCKCMRCEIMKRQFSEGDDSYTKWGIYPCQHLSRKKYYNQYFYDSD